MEFEIQEVGKFKYVDEGDPNGEILVLLHGLFGALSNFSDLINYFKKENRVIIPLLPLYDNPVDQTSIHDLLIYLNDFVAFKGISKFIAIGNSLGGHLALKYALSNPVKLKGLVLTGSSGLFENSMGSSYPKKGDYEYVKVKTQETFYDPAVASKELIDEVFDIVNSREKALRVLYMARSAIKDNLKAEVPKIKLPTLVIWGKNDSITPPFVAEEFHKLLERSKLVWIDKCGHAAMMEHPETFNKELENFINTLN